jgi:hypothetical protein
VDSQNLAARAGRWSAANWKKAFFGWLLVAFVALVMGTAVGHKQAPDSQLASGEAAKAQRILEQAHFKAPATESVLVQSDPLGSGFRVGKAAETGSSSSTQREPFSASARSPKPAMYGMTPSRFRSPNSALSMPSSRAIHTPARTFARAALSSSAPVAFFTRPRIRSAIPL